jgi:hypothetical protein
MRGMQVVPEHEVVIR